MREFVRHSAIYGASDATLAVFGLLTTPILTRVFDPATYGTREFIANVLTLLSPVLLLGFDNAVPALFVDPTRTARRREYVTTGLVTVVLWAALALPASALALAITRPASTAMPGARDALLLGLASAFPLTIVAYTKYVLRFRFAAGAFATLAVTSGVLVTVASIGAVTIFGLGIRGLYLGQIVGALAPAALALWLSRRDLGGRLSRRTLGELLRIGLPSIPATLVYLAYTLLDRQILGAVMGQEAVGVYAVGVRVATIPLTIATVVALAWYPLASRAIHAGPAYARLFADATRYIVSGLALVALTIALFGREIVAIAAPAEYALAAVVAIPLAFAVAIGGFGTIAGAAIFARRRLGLFIVTNGLALVANGVAALVLVPRVGIVGAAFGVGIGQTVWTGTLLIIASRLLPALRASDLRAPTLALGGAALLAVVSATLGGGTDATSWIMRTTMFLSYFPVLVGAGVIGRREWVLLRTVMHR